MRSRGVVRRQWDAPFQLGAAALGGAYVEGPAKLVGGGSGGGASLEYLEGKTLPGLAAMAGQNGGEHAAPDAAESEIGGVTVRGSR